MKHENPPWLKSKGYLHITSQLDVVRLGAKILSKVKNPNYISKYAFFPLIHSVIKERKYKRIPSDSKIRSHSYKDDSGKHIRTVKNRPLHYATHMDAIIFGYYAEILQSKYEDRLRENTKLNESIIAYRKIPIANEQTNKGTIHFANEVFEEIKRRSLENDECVVLAFDIKSFFPTLDHELLKKAWAKLVNKEKLPDDHYNVFKAATKFSYILKDDLRINKINFGRRSGFDEKELARIRNNFGINAFFESPKAFREVLKSGSLRIHKFPFRNDKGVPIGIPQGLPISAILANLYLLEFDSKISLKLIDELGCFYRRYSDDIVVVCNGMQKEFINKFVTDCMLEFKVKISVDKTETFFFKKILVGNKGFRLTSLIQNNMGEYIPKPFIYLGFEFNGTNALIKSSNLSKFYRRMISSIKRKASRANKISNVNSGSKPAVFRRQLYKLYSALDLNKVKNHIRWKRLIKTDRGNFKLISGEKDKLIRSNYFSYAKRASEIMNEPKIYNQIRNHRKIFNQAIEKHLKKKNLS